MNLSQYIAGLRNKKIGVLGIGVSNRPLIKRLLKEGCSLTAYDKSDRSALGEIADEIEESGGRLVLGPSYLDKFDDDVIFKTPGIRPDVPALEEARKRGAVVTSEMEAFFEVCPCKIIAVTGSDGKTTTTTIISELLKASGYTVHLGGNIGRPLLCDADSIGKDDVAVLELSSFQLMTMKKCPDIAVVTNVAPNHLDVHKDMDEYIRAKANIFLNQPESGRIVLNYDNDITRKFAESAKGKIVFFSRQNSIGEGVFLKDGNIAICVDGVKETVINTEDILIPGVHNIENYMAAFGAVYDMVSPETMCNVAKSFGGVEHRIELVRRLRGVSYYNDSIASSPTRTIAGLHSFKQKVILIAGGKDKGVPFDELGHEIIKHVKTLVLTGYTADKIKDAVTGCVEYKGAPPIIVEDDFKAAVLAAAGSANEGDVVILSPACTSFDKFKNFAERGRIFKEIVNQLK